MPQYLAVFCSRSDGVKAVTLPNGRSETNGPTAEQLSKEIKRDKAGSCYDYYRELQPTDSKHIDWRLKLGAMWARERGDDHMKSRVIFCLRGHQTDGENRKCSRLCAGCFPRELQTL